MTHGDAQLIAALGDGNLFDEQVADAIEDGATDMEASQVDVDSTSLVGVGTNVQTVLEELDDSVATNTSDIAALQEFGPVAATLSADATAAEDATPNATGLVCAVAANTTYIFELVAVVTATVNGGVRFGWTVPAAATMETTAFIYPADDTVAIQVGGDQSNEVNYKAAALSEDVIIVKGRVVVGATAGNFRVNFAQDTSHVDTSTLHAESTLLLVPATVN